MRQKNVELSNEQLAQLLERLKPSPPEAPKINPWIQILIVPILIACFGAAVTIVYNRQQNQLNRIQTLEKFLPYFAQEKPTQQKIVASRVVVELGYPDLATDLLLLNPQESKNDLEEFDPVLPFLVSQAEAMAPRLCELAAEEADSPRGLSAVRYIGALYRTKSTRLHILHILSSPESSDERIAGALVGVENITRGVGFGSVFVTSENWQEYWEPLESTLMFLYSDHSDALIRGSIIQLLGRMSLSRFSKSKTLVKDILLDAKYSEDVRDLAFSGLREGATTPRGLDFPNETWELMKQVIFDTEKEKFSPVRFNMAVAARGRFQDEFFHLLRTGSSMDKQIALEGIPPDLASHSDILTRLLDASLNENDPDSRLRILEKISLYPNDSRALDLAVASVGSKADAKLRATAYQVLANFPLEQAHKVLRSGLAEKDPDVFRTVLYTLAGSCDPKDWSALSNVLLQIPRDKVFHEVGEALASTRKRCMKKPETDE